jgi:UDP-N-acetylglucosamine 2-epimerase (non-hydrolysing)
MLKVMTIVGTRPEVIRLSRIIEKLDRHCAHVLIHTGQNFDYELNEVFFLELGIRRPDGFLAAAGASAAETIGNVIISADRVLKEHKPDALLLLGDTNSSLAAISAKRLKVPIFHMEAGNRCFDFRVPEEINRRIVDHVADINLPYSEIARNYLLREGLSPDQIIKTGSPLREVIEHNWEKIQASNILVKLALFQYRYFVVSLHREENVDVAATLRRLLGLLTHLADKYGDPVIVSTHPRTRRRIDELGLPIHPNVFLHKPFGFLDYIKLQVNARAVLSDSGTITEESSILNFPALNVRDVHERPEGFEETSVMMVSLEPDHVDQALDVLAGQARGPARTLRLVRDYESNNVSDKVLRIILSYTEFVRRRVWGKR